jgi:hypothetical protein
MRRLITDRLIRSVAWGRKRVAIDHVNRDAAVGRIQVMEELNVSHMTVWRVLHEQLLYPYPLRVQDLMPADFQRERIFVGVLLTRC